MPARTPALPEDPPDDNLRLLGARVMLLVVVPFAYVGSTAR